MSYKERCQIDALKKAGPSLSEIARRPRAQQIDAESGTGPHQRQSGILPGPVSGQGRQAAARRARSSQRYDRGSVAAHARTKGDGGCGR